MARAGGCRAGVNGRGYSPREPQEFRRGLMSRRSERHRERHVVTRLGWLRPAILGANDGVVSTASLIVGVAAGGAARGEVILAGVAALVAGAMSMAAGEYVSVSSQSDAEQADLARERAELADDPAFEREELAQIYMARGVEPALARRVAEQLMAKDALDAHARDELHIFDTTAARPVQAAVASAGSFAAGAGAPLLAAWAAPTVAIGPAVAGVSLVSLATLGGLGARAGDAPLAKAVARVMLWGALAMAVTSVVGLAIGAAV